MITDTDKKTIEDIREAFISRHYEMYSMPSLTIGYSKINEMLKDPQIQAGIQTINETIIQVDWQVVHENEEIESFLNAELERVWYDIMDIYLDSLPFGFICAEKLYSNKFPDNLWRIKEIRKANQSSSKIIWDEENNVVGFKCSESQEEMIPIWKSIIFARNSSFGNPYGESILNGAYNPWFAKQAIQLSACRYLEKRAVPILKNFYTGNRSAMEQSNEIGSQIRNNSLVSLPAAQKDQPQADIVELGSQKQGDQFQPYLEYFDRMILRAMGLPDRVISIDDKGGAYAIGEVHKNIFLMTQQGRVDRIMSAVNKHVCRILIDLNWGSNAPNATIRTAQLLDTTKSQLQEIMRIGLPQAIQLGLVDIDWLNLLEQYGLEGILTDFTPEKPSTSDMEFEEKETIIMPSVKLRAVYKPRDLAKKTRKEMNEIHEALAKTSYKNVYKPLFDKWIKETKQGNFKFMSKRKISKQEMTQLKNLHTNVQVLMWLYGAALVKNKVSETLRIHRNELNNTEKILLRNLTVDVPYNIQDWINVPPTEAIEYFKTLVPMEKAKFIELQKKGYVHGFTVAGYEKQYIEKVWKVSILKALEEGQGFDVWKKDIVKTLNNAGLYGESLHHLKTVYRTNTHNAYMAGSRYQQLDPDVKDTFPYAEFICVMDDRSVEPCISLNTFTARIDDPEWNEITPPLHHNCRSDIVQIDKWLAKEKGIDDSNLSEFPSNESGVRVKAAPGFETSPMDEWIQRE